MNSLPATKSRSIIQNDRVGNVQPEAGQKRDNLPQY